MSEKISKFHPSKFNYSKFNIEFCIECQDTREVLGHSSIDCPEMICKNCSVKGKAMKSSLLLGPFDDSEFWGFSLLKIKIG